jgi:hypothetical protein
LFANRFTALVDACTLVDPLRRNLLLSLAEAGFFRLRWSSYILNETEVAIEEFLTRKGMTDAAEEAKRARVKMEVAFEDAMVTVSIISCPLRRACPIPTTLTLSPRRSRPRLR